MVCQAASQTRFRALKHESGIAGRPTIIVRVIACFQPLQDCQVSPILICQPFVLSLFVLDSLLSCLLMRHDNTMFALAFFFFQAEYFRALLKPVT